MSWSTFGRLFIASRTGLALGMAFLLQGQQEQADPRLLRLAQSTDPIIRAGACHAYATAYAGTGNNTVVRKCVLVLLSHCNPIALPCLALPCLALPCHHPNPTSRLLHVAVSDANDDVRRAAATAIGFVMLRFAFSLLTAAVVLLSLSLPLPLCCHLLRNTPATAALDWPSALTRPSLRQPAQVPTLLALLAESFNPHVRAGCCMAVGVACAGTGLIQALALLEPMYKVRDHVYSSRVEALPGAFLCGHPNVTWPLPLRLSCPLSPCRTRHPLSGKLPLWPRAWCSSKPQPATPRSAGRVTVPLSCT